MMRTTDYCAVSKEKGIWFVHFFNVFGSGLRRERPRQSMTVGFDLIVEYHGSAIYAAVG